ncbi:DNA-directed RNA polymerase [Candidatus Woesearchaeota archaeon]|nr:DNA-directed RNA polymerase [Candidatus Woesearchaeota archaeon]
MFYKVQVQDHIRVPPHLFSLQTKDAVTQMAREKFDGYISKDMGIVIDVSDITDIKDGVIIPGDGAAYYHAEFALLTFKPEMHEVVFGKIKDIADFGAFINIGPAEGMIHVSQTMDDFVSFSKDKVLVGKESKRSLKVNDLCLAKIIAVSFKDLTNPKLGLTMRQECLGKLEWLEEKAAPEEKEQKGQQKGQKGKEHKKEQEKHK